MPTAAKVVAALFFAAFGYFVSDLVKPLLPEGTPTPWLNETVAAVGLLMGWNMVGRNVGDGYRASIGFGLTAVALIAFWSVVIFAGVEMLQMSMDRRFNGPMAAIKGMFRIAIDYFRLIGTVDIVVSAVISGVVGGWLAEWASKRWN